MLQKIIGWNKSAPNQRGWHPFVQSSNLFRNITIALAVVGLLCASNLGAEIGAIAAFTIIGIPLALAILTLPTIALATVLAYLVWRFSPLSGRSGIVASYVAAIAIMLAIPPLHNLEIKAKVNALVSGDVGPAGELPKIRKASTIGLPGTDRRASRCDLVCMHLLMSRQAQGVIMARFDKDASLPDFAATGYRYRLERKGECDLSYVVARNQDFKQRRPVTIAGRYGKLVDAGTCITRVEALLSEAQTVISSRAWQKFPQPSTLSPINSDIRASRTGIYQADNGGTWRTQWQKTNIHYSLLKPILAHSWKQSGWSFDSQWWRTHFKADRHLNLKKTLSAVGYSMPEKLR